MLVAGPPEGKTELSIGPDGDTGRGNLLGGEPAVKKTSNDLKTASSTTSVVVRVGAGAQEGEEEYQYDFLSCVEAIRSHVIDPISIL